MSKKEKVQGHTNPQKVHDALATPAVKPIGVKGPKGAELTARITILAATNPKRPNTKAFDVFAKYRTGMSVSEFMTDAGSEATPNMVYDVKHGFIEIEGYTVAVLPAKVPRVVKEKADKTPKTPKVKAEKLPPVEVDEQLALETVEEEA